MSSDVNYWSSWGDLLDSAPPPHCYSEAFLDEAIRPEDRFTKDDAPKPCGNTTCPPLEEIDIEILPGQPEPGAFARAVAEHYHGTEFAGVFTPDYEDEL